MSDRYRAGDVNAAYFVTLTTVGWVDIFTRLNQKLAIVESLRYCQQHKELVIFAWCLMPSLPLARTCCPCAASHCKRSKAGV